MGNKAWDKYQGMLEYCYYNGGLYYAAGELWKSMPDCYPTYASAVLCIQHLVEEGHLKRKSRQNPPNPSVPSMEKPADAVEPEGGTSPNPTPPIPEAPPEPDPFPDISDSDLYPG